jgi:hypothetical protein
MRKMSAGHSSSSKNKKMACNQNLSIFGVTKFAGLKFIPPQTWESAKVTASRLGFEVQKSKIAEEAGNGVFRAQNAIKLSGGKEGLFLFCYDGEPLMEWLYDALESKDMIFTGIQISSPSNEQFNGIWRGVVGTLGPTINSVTTRSSDANVEFRLNWSKVDFRKKIFDGDGFVEIWLRPGKILVPGQELFLYYRASFWKQYAAQQNREDYCCVCVQYICSVKNPIFLCDKCSNGFHLNCSQDKTNMEINDEPWYCQNCSALAVIIK